MGNETPAFPSSLPPIQFFLDSFPAAMTIYQIDGLLIGMNKAAEEHWGVPREQIIGNFNAVTDPQGVSQGSPALFQRIIAGETVVTPPVRFNPHQTNTEHAPDRLLWLQATLFPLRDPEGAIQFIAIYHQDVTEQVAQSRLIAAAQYEIEGQRDAIIELSSPVIQVWDGILTLPLIGAIDTRRAQAITEGLLTRIAEERAEVLILDITGVPVVDAAVANYLISAARAARLLGCLVVLVGISPEVAQTLVQIGFDPGQFVARSDLRAGIAWAFERKGLQVTTIPRHR